jgi:hypothetical protein
VTVGQAAEILHMSLSDTQALLDHHVLPYNRHADGVRLIRRHQLRRGRRVP